MTTRGTWQQHHIGHLMITVELEPAAPEFNISQRRKLVNFTEMLVGAFSAERICVTWAAAVPEKSAVMTSIIRSAVNHEVALLGDESWLGPEVRRPHFAQALSQRLGQGLGAGVRSSTIVTRVAPPRAISTCSSRKALRLSRARIYRRRGCKRSGPGRCTSVCGRCRPASGCRSRPDGSTARAAYYSGHWPPPRKMPRRCTWSSTRRHWKAPAAAASMPLSALLSKWPSCAIGACCTLKRCLRQPTDFRQCPPSSRSAPSSASLRSRIENVP